MQQLDLETYANSYPQTAGHRKTDTSREAAKAVDRDPSRKQRCYVDIMRELRQCSGLTAHELADRLGYDFDYLQPRCSELKELGKIRPNGCRNNNKSKRAAEELELVG